MTEKSAKLSGLPPRPIRTPYQTLKSDLSDVSPLILGGAAFSVQYTPDPASLSAEDILTYAFDHGINAIDTSPYYGPSEIILGEALTNLVKEGKVKRENFYIFTKAGRINLEEFDYSPDWIEASVRRSLERFNTTYIDSVYLHDVEFIPEAQVLDALRRLKSLKQEGVINNFGISGYPIKYLYQIAKKSYETDDIGPLDDILSYCNLNLQNALLLEWHDKFIHDTGLRLLNNGSILSMSLLSSQVTRSFHPASPELKEICQRLANKLTARGIEIAEVSTRYALRKYLDRQGATVLGCCSIEEIESALNQYWKVVEGSGAEEDSELFEECIEFLGDFHNQTWASGIAH